MSENRNWMFRPLTEVEIDQYRFWARGNYVPGSPIDPMWHPVIRVECELMNVLEIQNRKEAVA